MITEDDFSPINFGVWISKSPEYEFVFQRPVSGDDKRLAQKENYLIVKYGRKRYDFIVKDVTEAVLKANWFLNKRKILIEKHIS